MTHQPRLVQLHGCGLDEDMWDRVVAHWRAGANGTPRASANKIERIRRALCQKKLSLQLTFDGPLLLSVTAITCR